MTAAQDAVVRDLSERLGSVGYVTDSEAGGAAWITGGAISADYTSAGIDCRGRDKLTITLVVQPTTDPIGLLYFQASGNGTTYGNVPLTGSLITNDAAQITLVSTTHVFVNDPAAAATITMVFTGLTPWMRFFYDWTSGGAATGLAASYVLE